MKLLLTVILILPIMLHANEKNEHGEKHESKKVKSQSAEAYLKAKKECLSENEELKGKALKDCIVKKQSEAK